jgi:hypothetical protein
VLLADDEAADPEIEGLLAQARAEGLAGQHARGLAPATRAQRLAEARGRPRLASEALLQLGLLHEHTGDGAAAASSFAAAYFTAEAAHHEAARAEAAVHLVHVTGGAPRGREEDALWRRLAEAIARGAARRRWISRRCCCSTAAARRSCRGIRRRRGSTSRRRRRSRRGGSARGTRAGGHR